LGINAPLLGDLWWRTLAQQGAGVLHGEVRRSRGHLRDGRMATAVDPARRPRRIEEGDQGFNLQFPHLLCNSCHPATSQKCLWGTPH